MRTTKLPHYGQTKSHRDVDHPLTQCMRLVRTWLMHGPVEHRELERLAAARGIHSARLTEALVALGRREEIAITNPQASQRTYRLTAIRKAN